MAGSLLQTNLEAGMDKFKGLRHQANGERQLSYGEEIGLGTEITNWSAFELIPPVIWKQMLEAAPSNIQNSSQMKRSVQRSSSRSGLTGHP